MTKIIDPDLLTVGTELTIDTTALTYTLNIAGNLTTDGVSLQTLYSKFKELWLTMPYMAYPFPMYAIDAEAGKYQIGTDGTNYSGWKPANDATRQLHRDGGWEEYSSAGSLLRVYAGIISLGSVQNTEQLYYQRAAGGVSRNFSRTGPVNEGVQVFGDAANGNFDERAYFKIFARTYQRTYAQQQLSDSGYTVTGPRLMQFAIQTAADSKVTNADSAVSANAPYTNITVTYYGTDQNRTIGGASYPFRVIINGANATAEQIYEKVQYLLRQNSDIDAGAGTVTGQTADYLLAFTGDSLLTAKGVYIDSYNVNDTNRITFTDNNNVPRSAPYVASGTITFNSNLTSDAAAVYRMLYVTNPAGNYGTANAQTVKDASGNPITGTIPAGGSATFTFAYDSNIDGGRTAGQDAQVIVVAIGKTTGKYVSTLATIKKATNQNIALVAEKERSYLNP